MRSRSNRFFIVLLHLVGCQQFHSSMNWSSSMAVGSSGGIVGVQPWPILLETWFPTEDADDILQEGVWLQDQNDQQCLGPQGTFMDCGDATLWLMVRQPLRGSVLRRRKELDALTGAEEYDEEEVLEKQMGQWWRRLWRGARKRRGTALSENDEDTATEDVDEEGLVFYLVDRDIPDMLEITSKPSRPFWWLRRGGSRRKQQQRRQPLECLVHNADGSVTVQACTSLTKRDRFKAASAWAWKIQEEDASLRPLGDDVEALNPSTVTSEDGGLCMSRTQPETPLLTACETSREATMSKDRGQVKLSVVRYSTASAQQPPGSVATSRQTKVASTGSTAGHTEGTMQTEALSITLTSKEKTDDSKHESSGRDGSNFDYAYNLLSSLLTYSSSENDAADGSGSEESHLPSSKDLAHRHASEPALHPELKLPSRLLFPSTHPGRDSRASVESVPSTSTSSSEQSTLLPTVAAIRSASPWISGKNQGIGKSNVDTLKVGSLSSEKSRLAHPDTKQGKIEVRPAAPRRIPVHPYISASKNFVWTDPQTGLTYPTDLSGYLGHDRKERGRHTLVGVGQYRKGYVVKVYGVALYVSKRDVLKNDAFFEKYAHMTTKELQGHPEFYEHLRLRPENFERSLMIKTNMQLQADTIRSSLYYDWQYLSGEAKDSLINSSLLPRPASDAMIKFVQSPENPGHCSCSAVVPESIPSDPTCCARGTELVFTWLKSGDLEVRMNGDLMDVFPRADIAQGIFYEYLRCDEPISKEFLDNAVEGFPFLLAPLVQLKGVQTEVASNYMDAHQASQTNNPVLKLWTEFSNTLSFHGNAMATTAQKAISDAKNNAASASRFAAEAVHDLGKEFNNKREGFVKRATTIQNTLTKFILRDSSAVQTLTDLAIVANLSASGEQEDLLHRRITNSRHPLSQWFGLGNYYAPDEIEPMKVDPEMDATRKGFLFLVHLYLLLMFMVSFPGSYTTRTKLIRKCYRRRRPAKSNEIDGCGGFSSSKAVSISSPRPTSMKISFRRSACDDDATSDGASTGALSPPIKQKSLSYYL